MEWETLIGERRAADERQGLVRVSATSRCNAGLALFAPNDPQGAASVLCR